MAEERRSNPALHFIKQYWFLGVVVAGLISMYFQLQYVVIHINPDKVAEQMLRQQKAEIRWCMKTADSPIHLIKCAD